MKARFVVWAAVVALLVASGCGTAREGGKRSVEIPANWTTSASPEPVGDQWWEEFGQEPLARAVEEALARNYDLQAAAARLEAAAAQARIAGAEVWPRLNLSFEGARQQQAFVGLPIPGAEDQVLKTRATVFGVALNSSWELDLWGRLRAGRRAAREDAAVADAEFGGARLSLAGQTVKAWLAAAEAARQRELAVNTLDAYRATERQVRSRYQRGLRSPLDVRLAAQSVAAAEALLKQREEQVDRAVRQLEILLGRYPARESRAPEMPVVPPRIPAGLPSELLERRPDLVAAGRRLEAADARLAQARASLYPRISLTASGGTRTQDLVDLVSSDFTVWTLAGNLVQPIFEGGRLRAGVDLARARTKEAAAQYSGSVLRAFMEVESALNAEQLLADREAHLESATMESQAALRLARERYASGLEDFVTVLEAQRRALEAESQLIAVRRQRLDTRVDLHLALGGGFGQTEERK